MECLNCHTEFVGNYCPSCGQPASTQRFTVKKALMATLEVWGMGNRSLPRTVWHLITRPGQMIGDYLDGKRMPFFPPVKMLFVLCIFFAVESSWLGQKSVTEQLTSGMTEDAEFKRNIEKNQENTVITFNGKKVSAKEMMNIVKSAVEWMDKHKAIELLCLHSFFMLFAWWIFRKSPTRPKSTMAEHFFTQVFMSGQMMALSIIYLPLFSSGKEDYAFYPLPWWMLFGLFVWDYKYIFGYKWKTTILKVLYIHFLSIVLFIAIAGFVAGLLMAYTEGTTVAK